MKDLIMGHKHVPGTQYYIHADAPSVLKIVDGVVTKLPIHKSGYLKVHDVLTRRYLTYHRLKCMAFKDLPDGLTLETAVCNHIDGDKYNNKLSNLEWTTYQGNAIHAVITGLRTDCIPGVCFDLVEGVSYEFHSLWDLSRTIEYHAGMIQKYLSSPKDYPFKNRFQIDVTGTTSPKFTIDDVWKSGPGSPTPVIVTNTETGVVKIYGTFANMSRQIGRGWIHKKKLVPGKILRFDEYEVTLAVQYTDIVQGHLENLDHSRECYRGIINSRPAPRRVEVTDSDGIVSSFDSLRELAEKLSVGYSGLKKRMSKYKGKHKNLSIRYL